MAGSADPPVDPRSRSTDQRGVDKRATTDDVVRRAALRAAITSTNEPGLTTVPPEVASRLAALLRELATLPGTPPEMLDDLALVQSLGLDAGAEWKAKKELAERLATRVGAAADPMAGYKLEMEVREQTEKWRGEFRPLPPCRDPIAFLQQQQTIAGPPRWFGLDDLIDEFLAAKSVVFSVGSVSVNWPLRWALRDTHLDMAWVREDDSEHVEQWTYRDGWVTVPEVPEGEADILPPESAPLPPGTHRGTLLRYIHEPQDAGGSRGRYITDAATFQERRKRALLLVRLFLEVIGEVNPDFLRRWEQMLRREKERLLSWQYQEVPPRFATELGRTPVLIGPDASEGPSDPNVDPDLLPDLRSRVRPLWHERLPPAVQVQLGDFESVSVDSEPLGEPIGKLRGKRTTVKFTPQVVHFEHGSSQLTKTAGEELRNAIVALRKAFNDYGGSHKLPIDIAGHADKTGETGFNDALAVQRANAVAGVLSGQAADIVAHIFPHGCGDRYAPDREHRPEFRVAVIALDEEALR